MYFTGAVGRSLEKFLSARAGRIIEGALLLGILTVMGGCRHTTLTIKADYTANRGQPVYVLIRSVNEKSFLTESYQDISTMIFKDPPDPSILSYRVILPGQKQKLKVEKPANASVGVYGLFTEPDEQWKVILPQPIHFRYLLTLERNRIVETSHE